MALVETQSEQNRHLKTQPSHRQHRDGNTHSKIHYKINHDSELDLTHHHASGKSIFMTDSSTTIEISEQNRPTPSMNTG
jgi:hypothetical protein